MMIQSETGERGSGSMTSNSAASISSTATSTTFVNDSNEPSPMVEDAERPNQNVDAETGTTGEGFFRDGQPLDPADEAAARHKEEELNDLAERDFPSDPEKPTSPPHYPPYEKLAQKNPGPFEHLSITLGPPVIVLFDIVVPCIIYYAWFDTHRRQRDQDCAPYYEQGTTCPIPLREFDKDILGYAIISFGFGELYILIARVCRLLYHRDLCAPLLSRSKWELDATSWVYGVAMLMALIPFVIGSTLEIPELYLYSPAFLMAFLGVLMLATLIPFPTPIGINSHARGTPMRPFIYYAAEDFIAVDGLQDREFRVRYNERYDSSKAFRRLFVELTIWWIFGVLVYIGCLSAVIWNLAFHYAFGLSLGVLFAYIIVWALVSYYWVQIAMNRQRKAHEERGVP